VKTVLRQKALRLRESLLSHTSRQWAHENRSILSRQSLVLECSVCIFRFRAPAQCLQNHQASYITIAKHP
jgi:hypothetical protein